MLAASRSMEQWQSHSQFAGEAALGWTGDAAKTKMVSSNGVIAVIDGAIYNHEELGGADNDAALLAALYARFGFADAIGRINGDFAAAVYDTQEHTLWLGRDRFGVKPLYYALTADGLAFGSRPAALLALPGVAPEVNRRFVALFAASHYRYFDNALEQSPYARISQLPPAHFLRFKDGKLSTGGYWRLEAQPDYAEPETRLAERYRQLLLDAVAIRLKAAKRPAFTLSGGMDSSSVLGTAVRVTGFKQHAYSTVYVDATFDESKEIHSMLESAVEQWHPVSIGSPDVFKVVRRMVQAHDEPVATATWLSHFLLCEQAARDGFGGLFGGLGGDELNAGEYEYFLYHFADLRAAGQEDRLRREVQLWAHHHDHPIFRKSQSVMENGFRRLIDFANPGRCLADSIRMHRYAEALNPDFYDLQDFEPVMEHPFRSYLKNRSYQDISRETIPPCLRAEDRQATAFGLDNFLPFLDYRLVEFMFRIPGTMKFREGVTKKLLREAMRGILPEETRTRIKKTGWNAPAHVWFSGQAREKLLDMVHSRQFRERGIYRFQEIVRLIDEHEQIIARHEPRDNHMMFLWQLVNLEVWLSELSAAPKWFCEVANTTSSFEGKVRHSDDGFDSREN
jgi:asparagine synthase (glutamine-hydrolysing)